MFDQIAILAPGLLGASVARAARHYGAAKSISLWARRPEVRLDLKKQSWCDRIADTPVEAVQHAQLVIVCAPVDQIVALTAPADFRMRDLIEAVVTSPTFQSK